MAQHIGYVTVMVRSYEEGITFYTRSLGFHLLENTDLGDGRRWVLVAPPGVGATSLLLAEAATAEQAQQIGNQAGGRVFLFLHTDDFWADYNRMKANGVQFEEEPRSEAYGHVAVFQDCYGNRWDLLERGKAN